MLRQSSRPPPFSEFIRRILIGLGYPRPMFWRQRLACLGRCDLGLCLLAVLESNHGDVWLAYPWCGHLATSFLRRPNGNSLDIVVTINAIDPELLSINGFFFVLTLVENRKLESFLAVTVPISLKSPIVFAQQENLLVVASTARHSIRRTYTAPAVHETRHSIYIKHGLPRREPWIVKVDEHLELAPERPAGGHVRLAALVDDLAGGGQQSAGGPAAVPD